MRLQIFLFIIFPIIKAFWCTRKGRPQLLEIWQDFHNAKKHEIQREMSERCERDGMDVCPALTVQTDCNNIQRDDLCEKWALEGECETNPNYMLEKCQQTCEACFLEISEYRCVRHLRNPAALKEGEFDQLFERILSDFTHLEPVVLSRDPWVIQLENLLSDEEASAFINHGRQWKPSVDAGERGPDGVFKPVLGAHRTSSTSWCTEECYNRRPVLNVMERISNVTTIPVANAEYPQMLKYEPGQWYNEHHDYINGHLELPMGPRIFTFFMYLNDIEDGQGGTTDFPQLDISVTPKKGRAVFWVNVRQDNLRLREDRTKHVAQHVKKGKKYGVNLWIHLYNFHEPFEIGCTG